MSKILSAETVMKKTEAVAHLKTDGPKAALRKMNHAGISKIFVLKDNRLQGIVTAEKAAEAARQGDRTLEHILDPNIEKVPPETPALDLFPLLARGKYPLAVTSENNRLLGVIIKGTLLAALAESTQTSSGDQEKAVS
jgi:glycine betaine/proline transport system ATP-binding protein